MRQKVVENSYKQNVKHIKVPLSEYEQAKKRQFKEIQEFGGLTKDLNEMTVDELNEMAAEYKRERDWLAE